MGEISNLGAGKSASALSTLLGRKVFLSMPDAAIASVSSLKKKAIGPKKILYCVFAPISGDFKGKIAAIYSRRDALFFLKMASRKGPKAAYVSKKDSQLILELTRNIAGNYIDVLSDFLCLRIRAGKFRFCSVFGADISECLLSGIGKNIRRALLVRIRFKAENLGYRPRGEFILFLEFKSLRKIIHAAGKK